MNRIKANWAAMSRRDKVNMVIVILLSLGVIVLAVLGLTGLMMPQIVNCIIVPAMGGVMAINGLSQYHKNRRTAIFLFISAGVLLACGVTMLLLQFA